MELGQCFAPNHLISRETWRFNKNVCTYVRMYVYVLECACRCMYIYVHIYISTYVVCMYVSMPFSLWWQQSHSLHPNVTGNFPTSRTTPSVHHAFATQRTSFPTVFNVFGLQTILDVRTKSSQNCEFPPMPSLKTSKIQFDATRWTLLHLLAFHLDAVNSPFDNNWYPFHTI